MEKDLGIYITSDLKPSTQCVKAARKARSVLAMVRRNFKRLDADDFLLIHKTYVRPHMEYCIQAWSPHLVKDIQVLESVQRTVTRMVSKLKKLPYESRLHRLGLTMLERRRIRGYLIETFKILTGIEKVDMEHFFEFSDTGYNLRGHSKRLTVNMPSGLQKVFL